MTDSSTTEWERRAADHDDDLAQDTSDRVSGRRAGRAAGDALRETGYATVGAGVAALGLLRDAPRGLQNLRQMAADGFAALSSRGRRTVGAVSPRARAAGQEVRDAVADSAEAVAQQADAARPPDYQAMGFQALRDLARTRDIAGRTAMGKEQLIAELKAQDAAADALASPPLLP